MTETSQVEIQLLFSVKGAQYVGREGLLMADLSEAGN